MKQFKHFKGVYGDKNRIYTKNLIPGKTVYDERLVKSGGEEFREFNHNKSKLGAGLLKGLSQVGIKPGSVVLYLGASTGTTVSHVSDIVGKEGFIFALDFAPRVVRDLVFLAEERPNIAPMLEDAFHPEGYTDKTSSVDVIFQDIAQRNQVDIFMKNVDMFLEEDGFAILALKARSYDVTLKPAIVFRKVRAELEKKMKVVDYRSLAPFEKDHAIFVCKR
ncbi:MAG: fibrillarin-like rRNA/tRNA 2'-O-methyltransferase [Nanobdellota archaeon]